MLYYIEKRLGGITPFPLMTFPQQSYRWCFALPDATYLQNQHFLNTGRRIIEKNHKELVTDSLPGTGIRLLQDCLNGLLTHVFYRGLACFLFRVLRKSRLIRHIFRTPAGRISEKRADTGQTVVPGCRGAFLF